MFWIMVRIRPPRRAGPENNRSWNLRPTFAPPEMVREAGRVIDDAFQRKIHVKFIEAEHSADTVGTIRFWNHGCSPGNPVKGAGMVCVL
jgi:hypothetical protein